MFGLKNKDLNNFDISFLDESGCAAEFPIKRAAEVPTVFEKVQREKYGKNNFITCPGMSDYAKYGYIMTAWDEIHIKASESIVFCHVGANPQIPTVRRVHKQPGRMDEKIVDGLTEKSGVYKPVHVSSPWQIFAGKGISCMLLPPVYHSKIIQDNLILYPGIVDYGNDFHTINFIFTPKGPCEIKIPPGEPLLHVLPFRKENVKASQGPLDSWGKWKVSSMRSNVKQFYRKYYADRVKFTIENIFSKE